ncbi:HNH endonuclease [Brevibacillus laterosporus]|nr:HNH endonuclease [Brevibacillus laterosporus]
MHKKAFNDAREDLISKWEKHSGQVWPTHATDVISKRGNVYIHAGTKYDAHEIIKNNYGGPLEWWNITPARRPDQHQGGIHRKGGPARQIFLGR